MYDKIAKAMIMNAEGIIRAINHYIEKEEDDLKKLLLEEGFIDTDNTIEQISKMEEKISDILHIQTEELLKILQKAESDDVDDMKLHKLLLAFFLVDGIAEKVQQTTMELYEVQIPPLASIYMQESDGELMVDTLRKRTSAWMMTWSERLGKLTKINTHQQIASLIEDTIMNGSSIADLTRKIQEGGWRNEYYQAKRIAITEVLRGHSVAREEGIQQCPAVEQKEWRHTGSHKNKPRENHVIMDGQIVPKKEPFTLIGRNGSKYYPMYPRDSILPAAETINCHCIHRGIVNKEVLGISYAERKKMQKEYVDCDNKAWESQKNEDNKAKAGIKEDTVFLDALKQKKKEKQIKYCGGKQKWALVETGIVNNDKDLLKIRSTPLKDLNENGILTVSVSSINHSTKGEFSNLKNPKKPAGGKNGGNFTGGGHSQINIDQLNERGIEYKIEKTYDNGVRIGGVSNHTDSSKRIGSTGQSWFPEKWDEEKIMLAGTYTANNQGIIEDLYNKNGNLSGHRIFQKYDDVTVGVITDVNNQIKTIFPDEIQREVGV